MASRWRAVLASGLVERGVAVVSGGAYGIDGAVHRAALAAEGVTVAVMAGGYVARIPVPSGCCSSRQPVQKVLTRWVTDLRKYTSSADCRPLVLAGLRDTENLTHSSA